MADGYRITFKKQNLISGAYASDGTTQDVLDNGSFPGLDLNACGGGAVQIYSTSVVIPWDRIYSVERRDDL